MLKSALRGLLIQFGQVSAGDLQAQHIAKEVLDARIGPVQFAFEVADQAGEARATEPASDHFCGKGRVVNTLTTLTPIPLGRMLGDHEGLFYQLHLLNNSLLVGQRYQPMGRVHRAVLQLIGNVVINLRQRKSQVLMFRMARLSADFAPFTLPQRPGWRFDNVAGRPLGRIARVFSGGG